MKEHCCIICNKKTVSVINTEEGPVCYNCYSDKKNPPKQKQHHDNEEARIQSEFFNKVPLFFRTCRIDFFLLSRTVVADIK